MTTLSKDTVLQRAKEAGFEQDEYQDDYLYVAYDTDLEKFAHLCRADLVAENERLRMKTYLASISDIAKERDTLRAEVERLTALEQQGEPTIKEDLKVAAPKPLTEAQVDRISKSYGRRYDFVRAIEAAHGIGAAND